MSVTARPRLSALHRGVGPLVVAVACSKVAFSLVLSPISCTSPGTNWLELHMATSASDYDAASYPLEVPLIFENDADRDVMLSGCPEVPCAIVQQWKDYAWFEVDMINCFCAPPTSRNEVIPPGGSLEFKVRVASDGRFRVLMGVRLEGGDRVGVYSNEFWVKDARAFRVP